MSSMDAPSTFATAARRCFTAPEIAELLSPTNSPLPLSSQPPPSPPSSGSLFKYDRSATRNYKQDGHDWVKKPVSRKRGTFRVREDFVRLRKGDHYRVAGFYARSETGRVAMRRRCYCLIDPVSLKPENDLVLVHYLSDVVRQRFDGPTRDSSTGHEVKTERTPLALAARSVINADEISGRTQGLAERERKEARGKRKISTTADGTGRFDDRISSYRFDAPGISARSASLHGFGQTPASNILLGQNPNTIFLQRMLALGTTPAQITTPLTLSQLLASPKVSEKDFMNEWYSFSEVEKHAIISDIYGTALCAEDQRDSSREVLTLKISLMNDEITKIPISEKVCYLEALRQCPQCSPDFKMQFLRRENFCPRAAALRLVRYWAKRVEMFGMDFAFVPLTLAGTMADFYKDPSFGRTKLLPDVDASGRGILLFDNTIHCTKETAIRSMWYMTHAAMEDDRVKRNGYIGIVNGCSPPEEFSQQGKVEQLSFVRDIVPLHCRALHVCNWNTGEKCSWFVKAVIAALNFTAGPFLRPRIVFHDGSNEEVILQLAEYGISRKQLPTKMGGTFTEESFRKWLALRVEARL